MRTQSVGCRELVNRINLHRARLANSMMRFVLGQFLQGASQMEGAI